MSETPQEHPDVDIGNGNSAGEELRGRGLLLPSFKWFLGGIVPWVLFIVFISQIHFWDLVSLVHLVVLYGWAPFCFAMGVRLAWKEKESHGMGAKVSRWLNLLALALNLGLLADTAMFILRIEFSLSW